MCKKMRAAPDERGKFGCTGCIVYFKIWEYTSV